MNDNYGVIKGLAKSRLYWGLVEKNATKRMAPYAYALIAVSVLVISMEIWKLGQLQVRPIIHL